MAQQSASPKRATAGAEPLLFCRRDGALARLTLNRPKTYHALSLELMAALQAELERIATEQDIAAVVIEGSGRGFCSGHDLKEIRAGGGRVFLQEVFSSCSRLMMTITQLPKPVIAQVQGLASAAGCQLVATCDLAVAASSAGFQTPGAVYGPDLVLEVPGVTRTDI